MSEVGKSKKKSKKNPRFDVRMKPQEESTTNRDSQYLERMDASLQAEMLPSLLRNDPGAGQKDPFTRYPIPMTSDAHRIVQNRKS